jgi:hypothetical protein
MGCVTTRMVAGSVLTSSKEIEPQLRTFEQAHQHGRRPGYRVRMDTPISRRAGTDRPNTQLAATVDQALIVLEQQGIGAAARFLEASGARFALICRVLAEPARRRATCRFGQVAASAVPAAR